MFRIAGCILAVIGCAGFAGNICMDAAKRLALLKKIKGIYENMKYYIAYQKATIFANRYARANRYIDSNPYPIFDDNRLAKSRSAIVGIKIMVNRC